MDRVKTVYFKGGKKCKKLNKKIPQFKTCLQKRVKHSRCITHSFKLLGDSYLQCGPVWWWWFEWCWRSCRLPCPPARHGEASAPPAEVHSAGHGHTSEYRRRTALQEPECCSDLQAPAFLYRWDMLSAVRSTRSPGPPWRGAGLRRLSSGTSRQVKVSYRHIWVSLSCLNDFQKSAPEWKML